MNVIIHKLREAKVKIGLVVPTVVVMTKTMSGNQQMEEDTLVQEECSSEDPPHLSELK